MTLAKVIKGTVLGVGYAASVAVGYTAGVFTGHKVYEKTGDPVVAGVAGGMVGIAAMEITSAVPEGIAKSIDKAGDDKARFDEARQQVKDLRKQLDDTRGSLTSEEDLKTIEYLDNAVDEMEKALHAAEAMAEKNK